MLTNIFYVLTKFFLSLRYRIKVEGLDKLKKNSDKGFLFLPNHPALIDPVIVTRVLFKKFHTHSLADEHQINIPVVKHFLKGFNLIPIADIAKSGTSAKRQVIESMNKVNTCLKENKNVLLYPAGQLYRSANEDLSGKSSINRILDEVPDVNIVLVRTEGLWGSSFSWATGNNPTLFGYWKRYIFSLLFNLLLFIPRRKVTITFEQPDDIPIGADRNKLYGYLQNYYNRTVLPNTVIPYFWWQGFKPLVKPEPSDSATDSNMDNIPESIKKAVSAKLKEMTGKSVIKTGHKLNKDLGMDSLAMVDLVTWLEAEYNTTINSIDSLKTVGSVILVASGISQDNAVINKNLIHKEWFNEREHKSITPLVGESVIDLFLQQAKTHPKLVMLADQTSGNRRYKDMLISIMVLKPFIEEIEGTHIGIMLPATVTASVLYLAVLCSGKVPVMINWTSGESNMQHGLDVTGTTTIITAQKLMDKIESQGFKKKDVQCNWFILESLLSKVKLKNKLAAVWNSKFNLDSLYVPKADETAVVLFTSGSESKPKAVPLSHKNILANYNDYTKVIDIRQDDILLSMLPPFHSFGIAIGIVLPIVSRVPTVYHSNPTEGTVLTSLIQAYKPTIVFGTPTFVNGILRCATPEDLQTLRLSVVGAEKCPDYVYQKFTDLCPNAAMIEGYGITECSPVVSANKPEASAPGSIGYMMPSLDYHIIHHEHHTKVPQGEEGLLIVKGDSIFDGYIQYDGASPFIKYEGELYYNTGDLIVQAEDGLLTFKGRLKRFIKLGGEMVSLPAIEAVLQKHYPGSDEGPAIAIEATASEDYPEIVCISIGDIAREYLNDLLRSEGLPNLYNIKKVITTDEIPVLGTGKTDYQTIKQLILDTYGET